MRVALVACYQLGHQPLHIAAPAATLRERGHDVRCLDLSIDSWDPEVVEWADRLAVSVPMHTAMRIARDAIGLTRSQRRELPVCAFGLYAEVLADVADCALAGEIDEVLVEWVEGRSPAGVVHLGRGAGRRPVALPARDLLPPLDRYVHLVDGDVAGLVASVEASHGCAHRCRHCPVPVVYAGRIRIVDESAVVDDIAQQADAGARHVTFSDPDFFNGAHHSMRVVRTMHERFPDLTFDCTVKVEHVLRHADLWAELSASGCLFVVSAFETVDEATLVRLDKGHTVADMAAAVDLLRSHEIEIRPSWMPFTPWTTIEQIRALLDFVTTHDLVANVDPVQYTIRLLLPPGSLLLEHPDVLVFLSGYDADRGFYRWSAADPAMDVLQLELAALVERDVAAGRDPALTYDSIRELCGLEPVHAPLGLSASRPHLTESWFCCAEPTSEQLGIVQRA